MNALARTVAKTVFTVADVARPRFGGPRILIYHQVGAGHGKEMDVDPRDFARHLDHLETERWSVVPLDDAIAERGGANADSKVVLTFDDGYEDMYTDAFPLLTERNLPFTLYLTTHPTDSREPLDAGGRSTPLQWTQIEEMAGSGLMTLGVHTHTHPDLRHIEAAEVERELEASDGLIEQRLGVRPIHFAYPWGYWSSDADGPVRARYSSAVLGGGPPIEADTDPMLLHRIPVQLSDGVVFFKQKLRRGLRSEELVRRRISGYTGP